MGCMADPDLFRAFAPSADYDASSIEVLEGLEPVRRRPGMYVGGTDERALHHLAAEILDNAMDEAVAGHATRIEVTLAVGNRITITDNACQGISTIPVSGCLSKYIRQIDTLPNPPGMLLSGNIFHFRLLGKAIIHRIQMITGLFKNGLSVCIKDWMLATIHQFGV